MQGMLYPGPKSTRRETVTIWHKLVLGSTGAITTQSQKNGVSAARTNTGLYKFTFNTQYAELLEVTVTPVAASYAQTGGKEPLVTDDSLNDSAEKWVVVQLVRSDTNAAAEAPNSAVLLFKFVVAQVALDQG